MWRSTWRDTLAVSVKKLKARLTGDTLEGTDRVHTLPSWALKLIFTLVHIWNEVRNTLISWMEQLGMKSVMIPCVKQVCLTCRVLQSSSIKENCTCRQYKRPFKGILHFYFYTLLGSFYNSPRVKLLSFTVIESIHPFR